jgi:hypothetical protein
MPSESERHIAIVDGNAFGLSSAADIEQLDGLPVSVEVFLYPDSVDDLYPLAPGERRRKLALWFKETFERINAELALTHVNIQPRHERYRPFACDVAADALLKLLHQPGVQSVDVTAVHGITPRRPHRRKRLTWYAIEARFAIQIEDQTTGSQGYEDRIVLVKAYDEKDAKDRLQDEFAEYASPYLNGDCELVRFQFEAVLDVCQPWFEKLDPNGTEVFFRWGQRKMQPEHVWHPRDEGT